MPLYQDLFRYRPRPNRQPLEDFLSAALCNLLNRLTISEAVSFVGDILLDGTAAAEWESHVKRKPPSSLDWQLQHYVASGGNRGIIDIALIIDHRASVVIEVKIAAPFRKHAAVKDETIASGALVIGEENATQLSTYAKWLAGEREDDEWPGAIVVLTHLSDPPPDFIAQLPNKPNDHKYGRAFRSLRHWKQIWSWARGSNTSDGSAPTSLQNVLRDEFGGFLEELGMSELSLSKYDFDVVGQFFAASARLENAMAEVTSKLSPMLVQLGLGRSSNNNYTDSMASLWSWSYFTAENKRKWYFGWGIRYPASSVGHWPELNSQVGSDAHLFLVLGTEGKPINFARYVDELPAVWTLTGKSEAVAVKPLADFRLDADTFPVSFAAWLEPIMLGVSPVLDKLAQAPEARMQKPS